MWILVLFLTLALNVTSSLEAATLTLWEHENQAFQGPLEDAIQTFAREHKGHEIRRRHFEKDTLFQEFQLAHLHGQTPDLVLSQQDFATTFATQGALQRVGDWLDPQSVFASLVTPVQDDRGIWGVPVSGGQTLLLFLNRKLIPTPPQSLEQLLATARRIAGQRRNLYGIAFPAQDPLWFGSFAAAFSKSAGALTWDPTATRQTLILFKQLAQNGVIPSGCDYTCAENLFLNSQAAMLINGDWARAKYEELFQDNLAVMPLPRSEKTGRAMPGFTSGRYLMAAKDLAGEKKALARAFSAILLETKRQRSLARLSIPPALKALADDAAVLKSPTLTAAVQAMAHDAAVSMGDDVRRRWTALKAPLEKALTPDEGVEAGLRQLQEVR